MPRLLDNLPVLSKSLRSQKFGLFTDLDGTINPRPRDFLSREMPQENVRQLALLTSHFPLIAVISGRETAALKEMVNIKGIQYIGHYGMEWWENNRAILHPEVKPYIPAMRALAQELEALRAIDGIVIQDKWATISLHYHLCPQPQAARKQILEFLKKSPNMRNMVIMDEKTNIGIIPPVNINKGTAITRLIRQYHLRSAIFLGDDTADVPGFRAIHQAKQTEDFDGLAILVTSPETPADIIKEADFTLDGVKETMSLFQWLTQLSS